MSYSLVTEAEFCWVLDWLGPAGTREIAEHLPTSYKGAYMRLRRFDGTYVEHEEPPQRDFRWWLTDAGRAVVDEADLPPIEKVDLEEYFAGRQTSLNPNTILHEIAIYEAEWTPTSMLYDALPYAKSTIRVRLIRMHDDELVERDDSQKTNHWRLTAAGREQLAEADDTTPHDDTKRIFEQSTL
ncbi:hypothetical protein ACFQMF_15565 [Halorubrum rutilum]|uniref:MarR family transcriptional regulator n=1 Tax=Halorubrum rutilum TaxID=1364933 RepID=A0ABD6AQM6_9EURY|nr:hypothetical protein [Halorubrum rutilum]